MDDGRKRDIGTSSSTATSTPAHNKASGVKLATIARHSEPDRQAQQDLGLRQGLATNRDHAAAGAQELAAGVDQGQVAAQLGAQRDVGGQRPLPADAEVA